MRNLCEERKKRKIKTTILALVILVVGFCMIYGYKEAVGPILDEISKTKAKAMVTNIINDTAKEILIDEEEKNNLFIINRDESGVVQLVQGNTSLINKIVADFSTKLQNSYDDFREHSIDIPYGTIIGSRWLSQIGPSIKVKISPLSVSRCNCDSTFTSEGINQTKYQINMRVESKVKVLRPFIKEELKISNNFIIAETIIMGQVPNSYVKVPKEDILDVTDE